MTEFINKYSECLKLLYEYLDFDADIESMKEDYGNDYLLEVLGNDNKTTYLWYQDGNKNIAINTESKEILSDEEDIRKYVMCYDIIDEDNNEEDNEMEQKKSFDDLLDHVKNEGLTIDEYLAEYKESCLRNGKYDMKDNAEWFAKENDLELSCTGIIEEILNKI